MAALPDVARAAGIDDYKICPEGVVDAELRAGRAAGAVLLTGAALAFPAALHDIPDAPPVLWCLGDISLLSRPMVALVGARNVSSLGTRMARKLSAGLSDAGVVVVSGLARGVDAEAHSAAIGGGTIAVMAGGVDSIYPPENGGLAQRIAENGLRVSEQPPGTVAHARHFVARNRIVSGLSRAVVVVEAAAKSGSLITARSALDQGRDVLAVPGHPFDARSAGSNMLLRDGAVLVRGAQDVLEHLNLPAASAAVQDEVAAPATHAGVAASATHAGVAAPAAREEVAAARAGVVAQVAVVAARTPPVPRSGPRVARETAPWPIPVPTHEAPQSHTRPATMPDPMAARIPAGAPERRGLSETAALHQAILDRVALSPVAEDQLIRDLAASSQRVGPALVTLELDGRIARRTGGLLTMN